ncbi:Riboflavin biosynthesis protein RibF [Halomicronema hongdechloris C2206]|uniref:Bifunctional riboflavin kinase/FMN adenylyltransferase n=1 Tax=Halomicronema hongdechloris C2206 TaxID=1641165 RepID=A0A1Z3HLZ4_9CYAN|nr:bifunctional riboflavin kinase/FAD synthetase [Halomicronema hongdechloris]ASC71296.1 Riboflavin biosynthesis protein RibF [Halomicronema hongdechloris C2206]
MWLTSSLSTAKTPTLIALGNFDGVHRGHQQVIQPVLEQRQRLATSPLSRQGMDAGSGSSSLGLSVQGYSDRQGLLFPSPTALVPSQPAELDTTATSQSLATVLTFYPHPQEFFSGLPRSLLTPLDEKALQLQSLGIEQLVLLPFNQELAQLSPQSFVDDILIHRLQAQHISVGEDFRFGHQRRGDVDYLQRLARHHGIAVTVVPLERRGQGRISSSRIRQALESGQLDEAEHLLGRPYQLSGRVVYGQRLGHQLGFPTANLHLSPDKFVPRCGVYSVQVYGAQDDLETGWPGVMNIGYRPTVNGVSRTIEVHLLKWQGDLYNRTLTVYLNSFIRPEHKFESLDHLKAQIQADCEAATAALMVGNCP